MKNGNRIEYLDSAGGILLIHMIAWHCWQCANLPQDAFWLRLLSFFMPWFFYKAGMFYKPNDTITVIKKGWKRLIIPYIIYSLLGSCVLCVKLIVSNEFILQNFVITFFSSLVKTGSVPGNLPLWFLFSLFIVRILYNFVHNKLGQKYIWAIISITIILWIFSNYVHSILPMYVLNISTGLFFYLLGNKLKNIHCNWKIVFLLVILYLCSVIFFPQIVDMRTTKIIHGNFYGWLLISAIGIIAFNSFSCKVMDNVNIFSMIGKNTMPIYCWHWIVLLIISSISIFNSINNYEYFIIELISILALIPIFIYFDKIILRVKI